MSLIPDSKIVTIRAAEGRYTETSAMINWCKENVGSRTIFADGLSEKFPWFMAEGWKESTWRFYRENDAVMFALRWC